MCTHIKYYTMSSINRVYMEESIYADTKEYYILDSISDYLNEYHHCNIVYDLSFKDVYTFFDRYVDKVESISAERYHLDSDSSDEYEFE